MKAVKQKISLIRRRVAWLISRWRFGCGGDMIVSCRLLVLYFDFDGCGCSGMMKE